MVKTYGWGVALLACVKRYSEVICHIRWLSAVVHGVPPAHGPQMLHSGRLSFRSATPPPVACVPVGMDTI
jgi:hypothetical protein